MAISEILGMKCFRPTAVLMISAVRSKLFWLDKMSFQEAAAVPPVSKKQRLAEAELSTL